MKIWLSRNSAIPIREQLIAQVKLGIATEDLAPGERLPSSRELARRFKVHPNTVNSAYKALAEIGLVEMRKGSGTYVVFSADTRPRLDQIVDRFIREAAAAGFSVQELFSSLQSRTVPLKTRNILVLESNPALREIIVEEIRRYTGLGCIGFSLNDVPELPLDGFIFAALSDEQEKIQSQFGAGFECIYLRPNPVSKSLEGRSRPNYGELLAIVSGWDDFLRYASLVLTAANIEPESILTRSTSEPEWERGLSAATMIICDQVASGRFPDDPRVTVFRLLSESSLEKLIPAASG